VNFFKDRKGPPRVPCQARERPKTLRSVVAPGQWLSLTMRILPARLSSVTPAAKAPLVSIVDPDGAFVSSANRFGG
jgi:hypothetical protein